MRAEPRHSSTNESGPGWLNLHKTRILYFAALCELFDKTDTGGDGTISLKEYMAMCDEYGIELTDEHIQDVKSISNDNGEVLKHSINNFQNSFLGP